MPIVSYAPIPNIWFYLLVVGVLISLATYTWQFRRTPGAKRQVGVQLCKGAGLLSLVLSTISTELPDKMFWINDIKYHVVWVTKYRYKVLHKAIGERLRELIRQGCETPLVSQWIDALYH